MISMGKNRSNMVSHIAPVFTHNDTPFKVST